MTLNDSNDNLMIDQLMVVFPFFNMNVLDIQDLMEICLLDIAVHYLAALQSWPKVEEKSSGTLYLASS